MSATVLLHSYSKLPFGKYKGFELGMIYLLAPSYVNWMLEETEKTNYCVGDIEFLESLKVIDRFGEKGWLAHHAEIDLDEFRTLWRPYVTFRDIKFSGTLDYAFSDVAQETNREKLSDVQKIRINKTSLTPEGERVRFLFYPGTEISTQKTKLLPTSVSTNSRGLPIINFLLENQLQQFSIYPSQKELKVAGLWSNRWGISLKEFETKIENKTHLFGAIREGVLNLEK